LRGLVNYIIKAAIALYIPGAPENICAWKGTSNRRLEKTA